MTFSDALPQTLITLRFRHCLYLLKRFLPQLDFLISTRESNQPANTQHLNLVIMRLLMIFFFNVQLRKSKQSSYLPLHLISLSISD